LNRGTGKFKIFRHDPDNPNSLGKGNVTSMVVDARGMLWIGLWGGGLNRLDPATETFQRFLHDAGNPASISSNEVWGLLPGTDGDLWAGTSSGLNRLNCQIGEFTVYRRKEGLSGDRIHTILEDDQGKLWLGTADGGITVFDSRTCETHGYDSSDGLQGKQFAPRAACKRADGTLIFGGRNGFNIIHPKIALIAVPEGRMRTCIRWACFALPILEGFVTL